MDRIIASISKIEDASVRIMEEAAAKKAEIAAEIKKETEAFDMQLEEETRDRICKLRASMEQEMTEKLKRQKEMAAEALAALKQHYDSHREAYVDKLFQQMTGA